VKALQGEVAQAGLDPGPEPTLADDVHPPSARLVIHAANGPDSVLRRAFQRLVGWLIGPRPDRRGLPLKLTVQDLEGHRISTFEPSGPLTKLRLTPGTYVVVASNGSERRTYTLTLSAGTSFELYVDSLQSWRCLPSTLA
jgi:hypothetical protein